MASIQYFKRFKQLSHYVGGKYNLCFYLKLIFNSCFIFESFYKDHANFLHGRKEQPVIWGERSLGCVEGGLPPERQWKVVLSVWALEPH